MLGYASPLLETHVTKWTDWCYKYPGTMFLACCTPEFRAWNENIEIYVLPILGIGRHESVKLLFKGGSECPCYHMSSRAENTTQNYTTALASTMMDVTEQ